MITTPNTLTFLMRRKQHSVAVPWAQYEAVMTEALASFVAEHLVAYLTRGAPHLFEIWRRVRDAEATYSGNEADALRAFRAPLFGSRARPLSDEHAQAVVAEHIWYMLALDDPGPKPLARLEGPKFHVTAPGPDGLSVYLEGGAYSFRVWEVKKHLGKSLSAALRDAYKQLHEHAPQYLAQYSVIGQELDDAALAEFYARLVETWIEGDHAAGAGVSVVTLRAPKRCFVRMHDHLAHLKPGSCVGLVAAIADFSVLTARVREVAWNAL